MHLVGLLFTLPVSNGKLERVFSTLKLIKVDKRSSLGNELLDDLLVLNSERVSLKSFNAISLWWSDKVRKPNQRPRKEYAACSSFSTNDIPPEDSEKKSDAGTELLQEWDDWINNN